MICGACDGQTLGLFFKYYILKKNCVRKQFCLTNSMKLIYFGRDQFFNLLHFIFSSCCKKLLDQLLKR